MIFPNETSGKALKDKFDSGEEAETRHAYQVMLVCMLEVTLYMAIKNPMKDT